MIFFDNQISFSNKVGEGLWDIGLVLMSKGSNDLTSD
jgi:hypothetical protein